MRLFLLLLITTTLSATCYQPKDIQQLSPKPNWKEKIESEILTLMAEQSECWNSGDIDCFMKHYWKSENLMFIGKSGITYGWQQTLDNYKKSYPDKKAMGILMFDILEVDPIDQSNCYVVGKWHLTREDGDLGGHYTLMWKKNKKGNWVIVSDHSS